MDLNKFKQLAAKKAALEQPKVNPHSIPTAEEIADPKKIVVPRTLGDVKVAAEAQKIYNPALGQVKAPTAAQQSQGTAPAMDVTGNWGSRDK